MRCWWAALAQGASCSLFCFCFILDCLFLVWNNSGIEVLDGVKIVIGPRFNGLHILYICLFLCMLNKSGVTLRLLCFRTAPLTLIYLEFWHHHVLSEYIRLFPPGHRADFLDRRERLSSNQVRVVASLPCLVIIPLLEIEVAIVVLVMLIPDHLRLLLDEVLDTHQIVEILIIFAGILQLSWFIILLLEPVLVTQRLRIEHTLVDNLSRVI